ncbi:MAG: LD-carboxypeptidase [Myxococcales bacterium]
MLPGARPRSGVDSHPVTSKAQSAYEPGRVAARKPAPLAAGDRIAVVAPSSPFDRERFDRGVRALGSLGFDVAVSDGLFARYPPGEGAYMAGDDAHRLSQLRAALADLKARALVLARGGYGLQRLVQGPGALAAAELAAHPRLVAGYSDATVLHELSARAQVPSLHGPMCTQLGEDPSALARLGALLRGEPPEPIDWSPLHPAGARDGRAEGVLRGGNLATLAGLCGTDLAPRFAGCLVLLEDLNEPPYRLDRLVTQLLQAGALEGARGFVIGDLVGAGEPSAGCAEVVAERLGALGVPVSFGAPFGHAGRNQPVAFGVPHALDAAAGRLTPLDVPTAERAS